MKRAITLILLFTVLLCSSCEEEAAPKETTPSIHESGSGDYGSVIFPELARH